MSEMNIGTKKGDTRSGPALDQLGVLVLEGVDAADAAADHDAEALVVDAVALLVEARLPHRLHGRGDREVREAVGALHLLAVDVQRGVEPLHLAGEAHGVAGGVELGDRAGAAAPREQTRPALLEVQPTGVTSPAPVITTRRFITAPVILG
jgi:hypothetical protein